MKGSGKGTYAKRRDYMREYQKKWLAARRAAWFSDKVCAKCGSVARLELDHVDRTIKVTHAVWGWAKQRRDEELAKCQALCYVCHKAKTSAELRALFMRPEFQCDGIHRGAYRKGCRCDKCKEANRLYMREWKRRREVAA